MVESRPIDDLGIVVLAGGLARRMGGQDKGLVQLGGRPMVEHVLLSVAPVAERVFINANRNLDEYRRIGKQLMLEHNFPFAEPLVVPDGQDDFSGPLAGLAVAIEQLHTGTVFMCPCDSPFVSAELPRRLHAALESSGADIAVPHDGERQQPIFLMVRRSCGASLRDFLSQGKRKIDAWFAGENTLTVEVADLAAAFVNINTEEERLAAEKNLQPSDQSE